MRPHVKFCGMTRRIDIEAAEALSIDFIGFVFVPSSPRSVTLDEAKELRKSVKHAQSVGVFADHTIDEIELYAQELRLDVVQLHGAPDLTKTKMISKPVIQAFRGVPATDVLHEFLRHCAFVLIDKENDAATVDFDAVTALPPDIRSRLFIAGGITPQSVRQIADHIAPFAVDCARGIESQPGIKDISLMFAFFQSLS